jgi:hypothetical protein
VNLKAFASAVLGAICISAFGSAASAHPIVYTLGVDVDFTYDLGASSQSFTNQTIYLTVAGDTSAAVDFGGVALIVPVTPGAFSSSPTGALAIAPSAFQVFFAHGEGGFSNLAVYGHFDSGGSPVRDFGIAGPGLTAWDTVSKLAPTPVTLDITQGQLVLANGGTIDMTRVGAGQFSASVPEPAAWAVMIAGLAISGAALRRRRRTLAA